MNTIFIGIAGGTGSGKTTLTEHLAARFGSDISVVHHDNYYKRQDRPFAERCQQNYAPPAAFDTDLMIVQRAFYDKAKTLDFSGTILIAEELLEGTEDAALLSDCRARARELDPLNIIFTSGSTGTPKGIVISHRAILDFTDWLTDFCGYTEHEVFGNQSPFFYANSIIDIFPPALLGAKAGMIPATALAVP